MKAGLYIRVSTDRQAEEGYSLDSQVHRLKAFCVSQGWSIASFYSDDGVSAKDLKRPALKDLLEDVRNKRIDVVLVYKLDRLTRSVRDLDDLLAMFDKYSVAFRSATEVYDTTTPNGRLFLHLVASLAQWERETIAERTRMGQEQMTHQGKWSGGPIPFGYDYEEGNLLINPLQAPVVREIFRRYVSGQGTSKILEWLNDPQSPQPAPNERWTQWALKYVLRNPLYAGLVRYGYRTVQGRKQPDSIIAKGLHEPIIDMPTWTKAEHVRTLRYIAPSKSTTGTYSLVGLLYCGKCGSRMSGRTHYKTSKAAGSPPVRHYICNERQHSRLCDMPMIQERRVEEAVINTLKSYYERQNSLDSFTVTEESSQIIQGIKGERADLERRRKRWMDAYESGDITSSELRERLDLLNSQMDMLEYRMKEVNESGPVDREVLREIVSDFNSVWAEANSLERKEILQSLIKRVDIYPDGEPVPRRPNPFKIDIAWK